MLTRWFKILTITLTILSGIILIGYTSYRAFEVPITHDEAQTYKMLEGRTFIDIMNYSIPEDHMLNTLLIKALTNNLGNYEWVIRLPNLFGHLLYLLFSFLILWRFGKREFLFPAFLLLNVNPYLLDFFSCARGYGLSTSLMLPSIYFMLEYLRKYFPVYLVLAYLFAVLAVITLVTLLNYYLVLSAITSLMIIIGLYVKPRSQKSIIYSILGLIIIMLSSYFLYQYLHSALQRLSERSFIKHNLFFNFYEGTIRTISFRSIYTKDSGHLVTIISYSIIASYLISLIYLGIEAIKKKCVVLYKTTFILFLVGIAVAISVTFQFEIFQIKFPSDRAALFFIPIFMLLIVFLLFDLNDNKLLKIPSLLILILFTALVSYNAIKHCNLKYYVDWDYDMAGKEMLNDIHRSISKTDGNKNINLGTFWIFEPSANYYRISRNLKWLNEVSRDSFKEKPFDFYYLRASDTLGMNFNSSDIIKIYPQIGTMLIRRR
jgi:hypothetical protein